MKKLTSLLSKIGLAAMLALASVPPASAAGTITLSESDWTGNVIDVYLAKVIMADKLGFDVQTVFADYSAQWAGLANGDLDVAMEMWPSFSHDAYKEFIEEKKVIVDVGPTGITGGTGWYVPTYVIKGDADRGIEPMAPDLKTYKDLNKYKSLFARPETGDKGMFLAVAANWESGDELRAENLGLEYKVVHAGTEGAWAAEIESAYTKGEPLLFYLWSPHWVAGKYDVTEIEFPPYTDECYGVGTDKAATYACDFPDEITFNVARAGFQADHPDAYKFIQDFRVPNSVQQEILVMVEVDGMEVEDAVRQWLDANPDFWKQ